MINQSFSQVQPKDNIFHISRLNKKFRRNIRKKFTVSSGDCFQKQMCLLYFLKKILKDILLTLTGANKDFGLKFSLCIFAFFEITAVSDYPINQTNFIKKNLNKPLNVLKALTPNRW